MATTIDRYKLIVDTKSATQGITGIASSLKGLGPAVAAAFAVGAVIAAGKAIIDVSKQYEKYANQLKLVTSNAEQAAEAFNKIQQASNRSGASLGDSIELFSKLKLATENLGKSTDSVVGVTEKFQKALLLSGADANTASAAIRQFGQAMASGTVRGDEFTSIVEALGPALAIMARESGLTVGELRKLSQEGELTAERFYEMVEASKALDTQFANLNLTTEQVQTNLGKTFDEVINKIDQAAGVSGTWRELLAQTNRSLADLFNTSQSLENLSLDDLRSRVESNALRIDEALVELRGRFSELNVFELATGEGTTIINLIKQLEELKKAREAAATASKAQADADIAEDNRIQSLLAPYAALSDTLSKVKTSYEGSLPAVERLKLEQERINETLQKLISLRTEEIAANSDIDDSIKLLQDRYTQLGQAIVNANESSKTSLNSFDNYWKNLIKTATDSVTDLDYAKQSIEKLNQAFNEGKIAPDVYNSAMEILNGTLATQIDLQNKLKANLYDAIQGAADFYNQIDDRTRSLETSLQNLNLNPLQQQTLEIDIQLSKMLKNYEDSVERRVRLEQIEAARGKQLVDDARKYVAEQIAKQQQLAVQLHKTQRTFAYGWKEAFESYKDDATNAAKRAEEVFAKTTKGMEDMIVNFAKTGKFEFKSFVASILEDLLRAQIRQSMASIFQLPALGGGTGTVGSQAGGLFGGFFATGGMIPPGRFGVVGENGPELVSGPANVTPNLGGGNVTYNIQAVDARSFKELVAADPGFIHAVATKGGSSVPRRR